MPTRAFDDGSHDVPPAVPGEVTRVVVVGAGMAGLAAANALTTAGVECVVVEARDRLGGRLHTVEVDGHPADLGGSWVHHPDDNLLSDWLELAGVPWLVDPTGTSFTGADLGEGRRLTDLELEGVGYAAFDPVADRLQSDLAAGAADRSAAAVVEEYLQAEVEPGAVRDRLRQQMAAMVEQDAAGAFDAVSARWALLEGMFVGDVVDHLPLDGYRSVLAPLAAGSDVRLGHVVRRIVTGEAGVVVEGVTAAGEPWREPASHVVVTVPLGVLHAGAIAFEPPLPPERAEVIARTGFGTMEKVVLAFAEPFWRAKGLDHSVIYPADRAEAATWTWDFGQYPTLMFLVAHSAVASMRRDPRGWALAQLEALYGGALPAEPTDVAVTDWRADPFAHGAYAHVRPGESAEDFDRLGEPVGRVLFAGEHTGSARAGYADGAMATGLREAKRLLRRASVDLRAPDRDPADHP